MKASLEDSAATSSYLKFFGLSQPPFAKLPRPSQIFHTDQHTLLMAHLANATKQPNCLVVISGADGSGKTALLNKFCSSLSEQICFAIISDACTDEGDFYASILKQLGFGDITGSPNELRHITEKFIVNRGMAGETVLLAIDNAERIRPTVFDQLRRVAAITAANHPVLSVVLVGNSQLAHLVSSSAMAQNEFKNQVYFSVRRYTEDETAKYIWQRLWWAGGIDSVKFSDGSYPLIYRYTGGVPRQINMLCNDALIEACATKSRVISASLIRTVADKRQLLPHMLPTHGRGRRKTDQIAAQQQADSTAQKIDTVPADAKADITKQRTADPNVSPTGKDELREEITSLREQVSDLTADKLRAMRDVSMRDEDIAELRNRLRAQKNETAKLANALKRNSDEIRRQNDALGKNQKALQESEAAAQRLAANLKKERAATIFARAAITRAEAKSHELKELREELDAQAAKTKEISRALANNAEEARQQNQLLADSRKAMRHSEAAVKRLASQLESERSAANAAKEEIARARRRTEELGQMRATLNSQAVEIERLTAALESNSCELRQVGDYHPLLEKLIVSVPACQTLSKYNQAMYNSLISSCEIMFEKHYTEQQIADALRVQQAEFIERHVSKASDKAVLNYARLVLDQLREFRIHGADLCFGMWVPQFVCNHDSPPAISDKTRAREYALLELVLRTFDANMKIPSEETVWPDIWPIFLELFETYGESNVSAHFGDSVPIADKEVSSDITFSLYQRLLILPRANASKALRWILTP